MQNATTLSSLTCLLLAASFTCLVGNANGQTPGWLWAKAIGGTGSDATTVVPNDTSGNVYTTGSFTGTFDFDPCPAVFNLIPAGAGDIFISGSDSTGNFGWDIQTANFAGTRKLIIIESQPGCSKTQCQY